MIDTIGELRSISKEDREEAKSNIDLADKVQALNVRVADLSARTVAQEQAIRTLRRALAGDPSALRILDRLADK